MLSDSAFKIYSIGIVAKDKSPGSWDVEIIPTELIVDADGDISATKKESVTIKDPFGGSETIEAEESNSLVATWLQFGSSRSSPPDVVAGETVVLFHYEGADQYYWVPLFFEPDLRKKETALFYFSNKKESTPNDTTDLLNKGYWTKVDTNNQVVALHTSTNDGEASGYDVKIDGKNGKFSIKDTKNNNITLDSSKGDYEIAVKNKMKYEFKTIVLSNGSDELISLLIDLINAMLKEKHTGNLGAPTALDPTSVEQYKKILQKLQKFKG